MPTLESPSLQFTLTLVQEYLLIAKDKKIKGFGYKTGRRLGHNSVPAVRMVCFGLEPMLGDACACTVVFL